MAGESKKCEYGQPYRTEKPNKMKTISILSGTDRPGSNALKIAKYMAPLYEREGVKVKVASLEDYPITDVAGGVYGKPNPRVESFNEDIISSDGIVMVIPEYNGSFPGILKLFIDYLPFPEALQKKPVAYVGEAAGAFGALRAVEQMQMICSYRNAHNFPERVFLQRVNKIFSEEDGVKDRLTAELLESQIQGFVQFLWQVEQLQAT